MVNCIICPAIRNLTFAGRFTTRLRKAKNRV